MIDEIKTFEERKKELMSKIENIEKNGSEAKIETNSSTFYQKIKFKFIYQRFVYKSIISSVN